MGRALRIKSITEKSSEHEIQSAYMDWVARQIPQDERYDYIFAVPNAGKRSWATGKKFVREGLRAGVLDVCIDYPVSNLDRRWIPGARIEFKAGRNKTTTEQDLWICKYIKAGYCVAVSYSWEAAAAWTRLYFAGELSAGQYEILRR